MAKDTALTARVLQVTYFVWNCNAVYFYRSAVELYQSVFSTYYLR